MLVSISFYGACRDNKYDLVPKQFECHPQIPVFIRLKPITIIQSSPSNIISIAIKMKSYETRKYIRMHNLVPHVALLSYILDIYLSKLPVGANNFYL